MRTRMSLSEAILSSPRRPDRHDPTASLSSIRPGIAPGIDVLILIHAQRRGWPGYLVRRRASHFCPAMTASSKRLGESLDHRLQLGGGIVAEIAAIADRVQNFDVLAAQQRQQAVFEPAHLADRERIEIAIGTGPDHADLLFHLQRRELRLLQEFGQARTAVQQALGRGVEVGAELRERRYFAVLRQLALGLPGDL